MSLPGSLRIRLLGLAAAVLMSGCDTAPEDPAANPDGDEAVVVEVVSPVASGLERTTTQPATVHAWYEARVYAKVTGYVAELNADIGTRVEPNAPLATLLVPELVKAREAKDAEVKRLEANERRLKAGVDVANAAVASADAQLNQAKAQATEADATLAAAKVGFERVRDLVGEKAVANRLGDEAVERYEAAKAANVGAGAAVTSAEADLELARAKVAAAEADLDVAKEMTAVAKHQAEEAAAMVDFATLRAPPFAGVVTERHVNPGDLVRQSEPGSAGGHPLFVVASTGKVRVRVAVPERDAPLLTEGDPVKLTFPALPGRTFPGATVARTSGVLDERTRTVLAEIDLPNDDGKLLPGMFGQATITLEPPADGVRVPANAVRYDDAGKSYVYVVTSGNEIEARSVTAGTDDGQEIVVTAGLTAADRVVKPSPRPLRPGQKVTVR